MFDLPRLEEGRDAFHQTCNDLIFPLNHLRQVICDRPRDQKSHRPRLLDLFTELNDSEQRFAGNAAPIQTHAAEGLRFDHSHPCTELRSPNRRHIPAGSGAQNSDVRSNWHIRIEDSLRSSGPEGCSETQPSLGLTFLLAGQKCPILRRGHEVIDFSGISEVDDDHPALTVGITIDDLGMILQFAVDLYDRSADRCINGGRGFCRFDFADLLSGFDRGPNLRQVDKHDVSQGVLGKVTDAHGRLRPVHPRPFMLLMVSKIRWNHDALSLRMLKKSASYVLASPRGSTYRTKYAFASSLAAALLDGPF